MKQPTLPNPLLVALAALLLDLARRDLPAPLAPSLYRPAPAKRRRKPRKRRKPAKS